MKKRYYTITEVKDMLGVSYDQVWYACVSGRVKPEVVGKTRLLTEDHVRALKVLFEERERCRK